LRIVNWNIERRKPSSWQARSLVDEIASLEPDYVCLTEAWKQSLADFGGHVISAEGGHGALNIPMNARSFSGLEIRGQTSNRSSSLKRSVAP